MGEEDLVFDRSKKSRSKANFEEFFQKFESRIKIYISVWELNCSGILVTFVIIKQSSKKYKRFQRIRTNDGNLLLSPPGLWAEEKTRV